MLYAPKTPSIEVEEEEDEVEEEEANGLLIHRKKSIMNIQSTLTTLKFIGREERDGPISPIFIVTTTRSMDTMNENAERSK